MNKSRGRVNGRVMAMLAKIDRNLHYYSLFSFSVLLLLLGLQGCDPCQTCCDPCYDDQPPAVPNGVGSITGDGYVVIYWNPVRGSDVAGYNVYKSRAEFGPYYRIGRVYRGEETEFYDYDVINGLTYYYAVTAFDNNGNESELSYETVDDTPRPEGWDAYWYSTQFDPNSAGICFEDEGLRIVPYNSVSSQYYLSSDSQGLLRIIPRGTNQIQDYGYTGHIDEVDEAPLDGWSQSLNGVEVIVGHSYVMRVSSGNYAKIRVKNVAPGWTIIDWAYQIKRFSTELSPAFRGKQTRRG